MTRTVVTIGPDAPLEEIVGCHGTAAGQAAAGRRGGACRRDRDPRRSGARLCQQPAAAARQRLVPDAEIRDRIKEEIAKQPWARRASIEVHVVRGEVELRGTVTEERARAALQVIAENVAGVRRVRHRFVWSDGVVASRRGPRSGSDDGRRPDTVSIQRHARAPNSCRRPFQAQWVIKTGSGAPARMCCVKPPNTHSRTRLWP